MSTVVKLSEVPAENAGDAGEADKERRYFELNGMKVEPRFAETTVHSTRPMVPSNRQKIPNTLKEKPEPRKYLLTVIE
jgi:hypothetical protein